MKLGDLTELASRNLREAILRNSLTTMGIAVGVASLVALLSLGVGLQELVDRNIAHTGLFNTVVVRPRQNTPFGAPGGGGGRRNPADINLQPPRVLDDAAKRDISALPNVLEVNPEVRFTAEARIEPRSQLSQVAGMAQSSDTSGTLEGMVGKFFSGPKVQEAILQGNLAKRLLDDGKPPESLIGQTLTLRFAQRQAVPEQTEPDQPGGAPNAPSPDEQAQGFSIVPGEKQFKIIGVIPAPESGGQGGFNNAGIYVPLEVAQDLEVVEGQDIREVMRAGTGEGRHYGALDVVASSPAAVADIEANVTRMGFAAFSLIDVTRNLRTFFAIFDLFLGIFGSLALVVASLGIINTLVMAILERRREIGVLKALGAADRDVRNLFFAEAGVMGLFGGIFGVILGWGIGRAIQLATGVYLKRQGLTSPNIWSVPWWLVLGAIVFSVVISLASGMYPAARAAKLDPVEALRYE